MTVWRASYFDGLQSAASEVEIALTPAGLWLGLPKGELIIALDRLKLVEPIGSGQPWRIELADGGMLDVIDGASLAKLVGRQRSWLGRWEASLKLALLVLPLLALFLFAAYRWGLPAAADLAARAVPASSERWMGERTLQVLDHNTLAPSRWPAERQAQIRQRLTELGGHAAPYRLEFRRGDSIGANAFVLPGNLMVVTDDLLAILTQDELMAVLAHEAGHIEDRHAIRGILRSSGLALSISILIGDTSSLVDLLVSLPIALADLRYSREFEEEADTYAYTWLQYPGRTPCSFVRALQRIEQAQSGKHKRQLDKLPDWLSSHPDTLDRMNRFQGHCPQG
ncbi:M48 family metallopeptidase [Chitinimonas sp. PSY-7]|uniref:M48 family metalloprotease n=1 Tax=Chitinimonas sp. PSY-7 TaxID=3459088 RepID=UPI00403FF79D